MANYCTQSDIEKMEGYTFDTNSYPTDTDVALMITQADAIINATLRATTNVTDSYGILNYIACDLVHRMINNLLSIHSPEQYGYMPVEISEYQKQLIQLLYIGLKGVTFEVGN